MRQIQSTLQLLQAINETQKEAVNQSVISGGSGLERKVLNYEKQVREFQGFGVWDEAAYDAGLASDATPAAPKSEVDEFPF